MPIVDFNEPRDLSGDTEFSVANGDFSALEIRDAENHGLQYFFDIQRSRLVKNFILDDRERVVTLCHVTLVKLDDELSARLRFWKRDKGKPSGKNIATEDVDEAETITVKASVNVGETVAGRENFWKLIGFLQSFDGLSIPDVDFRVVGADSAQLARALEGQDKTTVLEAVRIAIGGALTDADLLLLSNRKAQLEIFEKLLHDDEFFQHKQEGKLGPEAVWQSFFEDNPWIFGYGLKLVACQPFDDGKLEQVTTGHSRFVGSGKRSDALMRTRSYASSLMFCEIKTHRTALLEKRPYRPHDVYQVSQELSGAVSQVQKIVAKVLLSFSKQVERHIEPDGTPTDIEFSTIRPRQAILAGRLDEFSANGSINHEKLGSFELYRNSIHDIEIITFDELYERACFIVSDT